MDLNDLKLNMPYVLRDELKALIYEDEILNIYKNDWQITSFRLWRSKFHHPEAVEPSTFWLSQFVKPTSEYDLIFRFRVYTKGTVYILAREVPLSDSRYSFMIIRKENPRKAIYSMDGKQVLEIHTLELFNLGTLLHEFAINESGVSNKEGRRIS